jgi:hypothetical protein
MAKQAATSGKPRAKDQRVGRWWIILSIRHHDPPDSSPQACAPLCLGDPPALLIGAKYPRCVNAARHEEITEWIGRTFAPEVFDLATTNQIFQQLFP